MDDRLWQRVLELARQLPGEEQERLARARTCWKSRTGHGDRFHSLIGAPAAASRVQSRHFVKTVARMEVERPFLSALHEHCSRTLERI
jgi:hypothetical protein